MNLDFLNNINFNFIIIQAPVILLSLTIHEYFHGWTANKLGDPTAKLRGRLTLNPIAHLDVFGTILMFLVGFGWAKPVPINAMNFKDPKKGTLLVAIAGPLSNLATAVVAGFILRLAEGHNLVELPGGEVMLHRSNVNDLQLVGLPRLERERLRRKAEIG